jgi:2-epi-5-epi-valiolone synthase
MPTATDHPGLGVHTTAYGWHVVSDEGMEYRVAYVPGLLNTGPDLIRQIDPELADRAASRKWLVFLDGNVNTIYGEPVDAWLGRQRHRDLEVVVLNVAESDKNLGTVSQLLAVMAAAKLRRRDQVVVIGGGVLSDLVGVAAAMWRKGIVLWVVPTTLVGAMDAGIAVKRGINFFTLAAKFKNLIGYYYAPELVLIAPEWWVTCPPDDITSAAAEMFKVGAVGDAGLVDVLEQHGPALVRTAFQPGPSATGAAAEFAVRSGIVGTLRMLQPDQCEKNLRRALDHGHNFGGALEMLALDRLPHGWGVGIDMCWSAALASQLQDAGEPLLAPEKRDRVFRTLAGLGVPTTHELLTPELITGALAGMTLHRGGAQNIPLLFKDFGSVRWVSNVTPDQVAAALDEQHSLASMFTVAGETR